MGGRQRDGSMLGLALGQSIRRHFNAVIATVAHQVGQRVGDLFNQPLVKLGGLAQRYELDLFAQFVGEIPQHPRKAAEDDGHGDHADRHDRLLEIAGIAIKVGKPGQQLLVGARVQAPAVLRQHGLGNHELTHQIDELIHFLDVHANRRGLHLRLHRGLGLGGLGGTCGFDRWRRRTARPLGAARTRRTGCLAEKAVGFSLGHHGAGHALFRVHRRAHGTCRITDAYVFLGYVECKQVQKIVISGCCFHRKQPGIGLRTFLVPNGSQTRDIAKQLLDGLGLLRPFQRTNLDLQGTRLPSHRLWCWSGLGGWSRCSLGDGCRRGGCRGRRRHDCSSRFATGHMPGGQFTDTTHQRSRGDSLSLAARLVPRQQATGGVGGLQKHIDHLGDWLQLVAAQAVQQGLHLVREFRHIRESKRRGSPLDRVRAPEDPVELLVVGAAQIEVQKHLLHLVQIFARFLEKDLIELAQVEVSACTRSFLVGFRHRGLLCTWWSRTTRLSGSLSG